MPRTTSVLGALLSVAWGQLVLESLFELPQHSSTIKGADFFTYRINVPSLNVRQLDSHRFRITSVDPSVEDVLCSSGSFPTEGHYYLTAANTPSGGDFSQSTVNHGQIEAGNTHFVHAIANADGFESLVGFNFGQEGKFRVCLCNGTPECGTDIGDTDWWATNNDPENPSNTNDIRYKLNYGFLHVVSSIPHVGVDIYYEASIIDYQTKGMNELLTGGPVAFLQASKDGAAADAQVSWIFEAGGVGQQDKFQIIDGGQFQNDEPASPDLLKAMGGFAGWECGAPSHAGPAQVLSLTQHENFRSCTNINNADGTVQMKGTCDSADMYTSEKFEAPVADEDHFRLGFLCYCDFEAEGDCDEDNNSLFGAALGPIMFRSFTTSHVGQHFTVQAAQDQTIEVVANVDDAFTKLDRVALVRLDAPQAGNGDGLGWDFTDDFHPPSCGWSHLDPPVGPNELEVEGITGDDASTYTYRLIAQDSLDQTVPSAELELDFSLMHSRKYELCYCNSDISPFNFYVNSYTNLGCPSPPLRPSAGSTQQTDNNNGRGRHFQTYYAQPLGTVHVVMLFALPTNVLLQVGYPSFIDVNFLSRPASNTEAPVFRTSAGEYYASRKQALLGSRFYLTEDGGSCGSSPAVLFGQVDLALVSNLYVRISDTTSHAVAKTAGTGTVQDQSAEMELLFQDKWSGIAPNVDCQLSWTDGSFLEGGRLAAPAQDYSVQYPLLYPRDGTCLDGGSFNVEGICATIVGQPWGALFSLTTGWRSDPLRPNGGRMTIFGSLDTADSQKRYLESRKLTREQGHTFTPMVEGDFVLCYCDNLVEFSPLELSEMGDHGCRDRYLAQDMSNFGAQAGVVHVRKFVNNQGSATHNKHYTVSEDATMVSISPPTDSSHAAAKAGDAAGLIPFYGDGFGVDEYMKVKGNTAAGWWEFGGLNPEVVEDPPAAAGVNPPATWHPWKTEYFCGKASFGTRHKFKNFLWSVATDDGQHYSSLFESVLPVRVDVTGPTPQFDFEAGLLQYNAVEHHGGRKFKLCYCSRSSGIDCPTAPNIHKDSAAVSTGFAYAYQFSDFAGYVHVVTATGLPLSAVARTKPEWASSTTPAFSIRAKQRQHNYDVNNLWDSGTWNDDDVVLLDGILPSSDMLIFAPDGTSCGNDALDTTAFGALDGWIEEQEAYTRFAGYGNEIGFSRDYPLDVSLVPSATCPGPRVGDDREAELVTAKVSPISLSSPATLQICLCSFLGNGLEQLVTRQGSSFHYFWEDSTLNGGATAWPDVPEGSPRQVNRNCHTAVDLPGAASFVPQSMFGITVGKLSVAVWVVDVYDDQHITVLEGTSNQTFEITKESSAITQALDDHAGDADQVDHFGILDMDEECGVDAITRDLISMSTEPDANTLSASAANFGVEGQELDVATSRDYLVCYCQRSLHDASCDGSVASMWYKVATLHVAPLPAFQDFIIAANRDSGNPGNNQKEFSNDPATAWVQFLDGSIDYDDDTTWPTFYIGAPKDWADSDKSPISCANALLHFLSPRDLVGTFPKGVMTDDMDEFPTLKADSWVKLRFKDALLDGNSNSRPLCMCFESCPAASTLTEANWKNHTMTVGQVWVASTVVLAGRRPRDPDPAGDLNADLDYSFRLYPHYTIEYTDEGLSSFDISSSAGDHDALPVAENPAAAVSSGDVVQFLTSQEENAYRMCGSGLEAYSSDHVAQVIPKPGEDGNVGSVQVDSDALFNTTAFSGQNTVAKFALCYCRLDVVGSCDQGFQFFGGAGFLHIVKTEINWFLNLATSSTERQVTVDWNVPTGVSLSSNDRFALIPDSLQCGVYVKCGAASVQGDTVDCPANLQMNFNLGVPLSPAAQLVGFDFYEYTVRNYADELDLGGTPANVAASAYDLLSDLNIQRPYSEPYRQLTAGFTSEYPVNLRLCLCSAELAPGQVCPDGIQSKEDADDLEEYYMAYGVDLGTISYGTFLTGDFGGQAFTSYQSDVEDVKFALVGNAVPGGTLSGVDADDRWTYFRVPATGTPPQCGTNQVTKSLELTFEAAALLSGDYSPHFWSACTDADICGDADTDESNAGDNCCLESGVLAADDINLAPGKYLICLCSASGHSFTKQACDMAIPGDFRDTVGYLTVLSTPPVPNTVGAGEDSITYTFGTGANLMPEDRFAILFDADQMCGDAGREFDAAGSYGVMLNGTYSVAGSKLTGPVTTFPVENAGLDASSSYKVCYCSSGGVDGSCVEPGDFVVELPPILYEGIEVGVVHVPEGSSAIDMEITSDPPGTFTYGTTAGYNYWFMPVDEECGDDFDLKVDNPFTETFNFVDRVVGFYRFCASLDVDGSTTEDGNTILDFAKTIIEVVDIVLHSTWTQKSISPIDIEFTQSLETGVDSIWFMRSNLTCGAAPAAATADNSDAVLAQSAGRSTYEFNFALLDPIDPDTDSFRMCVSGGRDYSGYLSLQVYDHLEIDLVFVPRDNDVSITFLYQDSLREGEKVWFQTAVDGAGVPTPCNSAATAGTATPNPVVRPDNNESLTFDFSSVAVTQNLYRLCGQVGTGTPRDYSPVGVYALGSDVTISPLSVAPQAQVEITITQTNLEAGQTIWFKDIGAGACDATPPTADGGATDTTTNSNTVTDAAGDESYLFDFNQLDTTMMLCVLKSDGTVLEYASVLVIVTDLLTDRRSVRNEQDQVVGFQRYAGVLAPGDLVWYTRDGVDCDSAQPPGIDQTDQVAMNATGLYGVGDALELTFDFSSVRALATPLRLCVEREADESISEFMSEDVKVRALDLMLAQSTVNAGTTQSLVFQFESVDDTGDKNQIQDADQVTLTRVDKNCPAYGQSVASTDRSGTATAETGTNHWVYSGGNIVFGDYRCVMDPSTHGCAVLEVSFATALASSTEFRVCVAKPDGTIADLDVVSLMVIGVTLSPLTFTDPDEDTAEISFTLSWAASQVQSTGSVANAVGQNVFAADDELWFAPYVVFDDTLGCAYSSWATNTVPTSFQDIENGLPTTFVIDVSTSSAYDKFVLCAGSSAETTRGISSMVVTMDSPLSEFQSCVGAAALECTPGNTFAYNVINYYPLHAAVPEVAPIFQITHHDRAAASYAGATLPISEYFIAPTSVECETVRSATSPDIGTCVDDATFVAGASVTCPLFVADLFQRLDFNGDDNIVHHRGCYADPTAYEFALGMDPGALGPDTFPALVEDTMSRCCRSCFIYRHTGDGTTAIADTDPVHLTLAPMYENSSSVRLCEVVTYSAGPDPTEFVEIVDHSQTVSYAMPEDHVQSVWVEAGTGEVTVSTEGFLPGDILWWREDPDGRDCTVGPGCTTEDDCEFDAVEDSYSSSVTLVDLAGPAVTVTFGFEVTGTTEFGLCMYRPNDNLPASQGRRLLQQAGGYTTFQFADTLYVVAADDMPGGVFQASFVDPCLEDGGQVCTAGGNTLQRDPWLPVGVVRPTGALFRGSGVADAMAIGSGYRFFNTPIGGLQTELDDAINNAVGEYELYYAFVHTVDECYAQLKTDDSVNIIYATEDLSALAYNRFDLAVLGLSHSKYSLCAWGQDDTTDIIEAAHIFYDGFGVLVSDITIQGSDPDSYEAVGCVLQESSQMVSFTMSSDVAFGLDAHLFFRAADVSCSYGSLPSDGSTTDSSDMVQMYAKERPAAGTFSFDMEFDFSAASKRTTGQPDWLNIVYRLCVHLDDDTGTMLDFLPLGLRVTTASLTVERNGQDTRSTTVRPVADQQVNFRWAAYDLGYDSSDFAFIADVPGAKCKCLESNGPACAGPVTALIDPGADCTEAGSESFVVDFTAFQGYTGPIMLCIDDDDNSFTPADYTVNTDRDNDGVIDDFLSYFDYNSWYAMACLSLNTGVFTVSPPHVPANDGQIVELEFDGAPFESGDLILWAAADVACPAADHAQWAATSASVHFSTADEAGQSTQAREFSFAGMATDGDAALKLCVRTTLADGSMVSYPLSAELHLLPAVVGLAGDPHVRSPQGQWSDFHGEAGVYQLYQGPELAATAKLGYSVRDKFMIWHPSVMRPGTIVEEVGLDLAGHAHVRLGVHGGGVVSLREALKPAVFMTPSDGATVLAVGGYEVSWAPCTEGCSKVMPWGTHETTHTLTVSGKGEFMRLSVASCGGYRFVDIESAPAQGSSGLLADASSAPVDLFARLKSGGEGLYQLAASSSLA